MRYYLLTLLLHGISCRSSNNQVKDATAESIDSIVRDQEAILKLAGTRVEEFAQSVTKWRKKCYDIKKKALEHVERTSKDSIKWTEKVRVLENENEGKQNETVLFFFCTTNRFLEF